MDDSELPCILFEEEDRVFLAKPQSGSIAERNRLKLPPPPTVARLLTAKNVSRPRKWYTNRKIQECVTNRRRFHDTMRAMNELHTSRKRVVERIVAEVTYFDAPRRKRVYKEVGSDD